MRAPGWKSLTVNENEQILYKFAILDHNGYSFRWTNLKSLFIEEMQPHNLLERNGLLNDAIEAGDLQLSQLVQSMLENPSSVATCDKSNGLLELSSNDEELGIVLQWRFEPTKATSQDFSDEVVIDSVMIIKSLLVKKEELEKLLREKDAEISNLLENGGTLSRKSLQTEPFDGSQGKLFAHSAKDALQTLSDPMLHNFINRCATESDEMTNKSLSVDEEKSQRPKKNDEKTSPMIKLKIGATVHPFARKRPPDSPSKISSTKSKLKKL